MRLVVCLLLSFAVSTEAAARLPLDTIRLPDGFSIEVFAEVPNARSMTISDTGIVFVGNRRGDKVWAVTDRDGDGKADERYVIAEGLRMPNGVAWHNGSLYVAEVSRILRYDGIDDRLKNPPPPVVVASFPTDGHHGWKFIAFGPDDRLYVPIGAPCNVCEEDGYAVITRMQADGSEREVFARGVRNTVGFDWDPATHELWFTDNGRDMMGDDIPEDELNHAPVPGLHFGFPYCHANGIRDPQFGRGRDCSKYRQPEALLGPHVAALGMRFYQGDMFPEKYRGGMFIAEHGSWNRTEKIGYRVAFARRTGSGVEVEIFASGWLEKEQAWGRPVDVLVMPDGALLVSDDHADVIYRISAAP